MSLGGVVVRGLVRTLWWFLPVLPPLTLARITPSNLEVLLLKVSPSLPPVADGADYILVFDHDKRCYFSRHHK